MENKKFIIFLVPIILSGFFVLQSATVSAYSIDTHAYLTSEIINFFNQNLPQKKIDDNLIPYLIDGSRKEDDVPRFMNHFYDPVYSRGLENLVYGKWQKSKDWAQDENHQNGLAYKVPATIASVLTAFQQGKISALSTKSAFVWEKALEYWIQGEKEGALFALGHIIHLIEDASVPDHTRNDPHASGSPYEEWTEKFTLSNPDNNLTSRLKSKFFITLSSLDGFFDELANYSNNNFYSQDTIGIQSGYKKPTPDIENIRKDGIYFYGFTNVDNKDLHLLTYKTPPTKYVWAWEQDVSIEDPGQDFVRSDYWSFLSTKSIQYGASIINLFFEEVEKNKNNPEFTGEGKSFWAQIIEAANNFLNNLFGESDFQEIAIIDVNEENRGNQGNQNEPNNQQNQEDKKSNEQNNEQDQDNQDQNQDSLSLFNKELKVLRVIDGDTIVIEGEITVRYIGIDAPEFSENPGGKTECYGKEARDRNAQLVLGKTVRLEKGPQEKDSFDRILAYVWVENTLVNKTLIAEGFVYSFNFNFPHPKDAEFEEAENLARQAQKGIWSKPCEQEEEKKEEDTNQDTTCRFAVIQTPTRQSLIINEIAWMGTVNSANDEWIEIKNISSSPVNLSGWQILDKNEDIKVNLKNSATKILTPGTFLLLERTDDTSVPSISADLIYSGALSNSDEGLRLFDSNCSLADEILTSSPWPAGDNTSKRTMERDAAGFGWHTSSAIGGTPRQENSSAYQESSGGGGGGGGGSGSQSNNSIQAIQGIFINEIMYNPEGSDTDREWIEIYNAGQQTVKITDLNFNENDTNHRIELSQGSESLAPGQYAVIAKHPQIFLQDFPAFGGNLFDSSFSLNNEGELLKITQQDGVIDQYTYSSATGANGNGKSLQKIQDVWLEATSTPGEENRADQIAPQANVSPVNHLVISEIQIKGVTSDDEFIEIYNPTNLPVSLAGYSIQYLSGQATSTINISNSKKNFEDQHSVPPLGFFLLAKLHSPLDPQADMRYSFSLSGNTTGGSIFIVSAITSISSINDKNIIDLFSYGNPVLGENPFPQIPSENQSLERKTVSENHCVLSQNNGEFLGNNCDTDSSSNDFILRLGSRPQNTSSFPEPRAAPTKPENLAVQYNKPEMFLDFSWNPSSDFQNNSSSLTYKIAEDDLGNLLETSTTTVSSSIDEVGRSYSFALQAFDRDQMPSPAATSTIIVSSFLDNLYFYKSPITEEYILEPRFSQYPFVPDPNLATNITGWRMIVFYLDSDAPEQINIENSPSSWPSEITDKIIHIKYLHCAGDNNPVSNDTLNLADDQDHCRAGPGVYSSSLNLSQIEDNNIILPVTSIIPQNITLNGNNSVTAGYYAINGSSVDNFYFRLVAVDKTPYQFSTSFPQHQPPITPQNFKAQVFDEETSPYIILTWDDVADPDSLDSLITYEINYHLEGEQLSEEGWQAVQKLFREESDGQGGIIRTQIEPKIIPPSTGQYNFYLRAKDEFELTSETVTTSASVELVQIIAEAPLQSGPNNLGFKSNDSQSIVPSEKVAQSFIIQNPVRIKSIQIALNSSQEGPAIRGRLSIQTANKQGLPSGQELATEFVEPIPPFSGMPTTRNIIFNAPPELALGTYFLVLESEGAEQSPRQYLITPLNARESYADGGAYELLRSPQGLWEPEMSWSGDTPFLKDIFFVLRGMILQ